MKWGYIFILVLSVFLFIGGPDANSHRIFKEFWDTGHVILFAGLVLVLLSQSFFNKNNGLVLFAAITACCLILGMAIELAQLTVGRNYDFKDVLSDLLGGYLGLLIHTAWKRRNHPVIHSSVYALMLILISVALKPLAFVIADDYVVREEFPILADFETPFEMSRWDTQLAAISIDNSQTRTGDKSMRIEFQAGEYPDITLQDFPPDWRDFKILNLSIYSLSKQPLSIQLRIYDGEHRSNGYGYADRFNHELILSQGWNDFRVELEAVKQGPDGREMDMSDVVSMSLFLEWLSEPMLIYLDSIRLSLGHELSGDPMDAINIIVKDHG